MTDFVILNAIIDDALATLAYSDANPDVGMGMFATTALDRAIAKHKKLAAAYGGTVEIDSTEYAKMLAQINRRR